MGRIDNATSLSPKYRWAVASAGGYGIWATEGADMMSVAGRAMWSAMPAVTAATPAPAPSLPESVARLGAGVSDACTGVISAKPGTWRAACGALCEPLNASQIRPRSHEVTIYHTCGGDGAAWTNW